ncbi:MAG: Rieske (2Fe-2S) protein [Betaproteobacteria bacterium]|nr:Rieske (2Fe-2S) protein [Betaproteobacteria bacterium]
MADGERLVCQSTELMDSGPGVRFEVSAHGKVHAAFAVRFGGHVYAYLNRCGHRPMELDWHRGCFFDDEGLVLVCSTHGAVYLPGSGQCMGGPCIGRGLESISVVELNGTIWLKDGRYG